MVAGGKIGGGAGIGLGTYAVKRGGRPGKGGTEVSLRTMGLRHSAALTKRVKNHSSSGSKVTIMSDILIRYRRISPSTFSPPLFVACGKSSMVNLESGLVGTEVKTGGVPGG